MVATDKAYLRYAPTLLASIRATTEGPIEVGVVMQAMTEREKARFREVCPSLDLVFFELGDVLPDTLTTRAYLSPLAFTRVFMPQLVEWSRFIYLDIDMIVRADLRELIELDLGDAPVASVKEDGEYNSGLMVVNADLWRKENLADQVMAYAEEFKPRTEDQGSIHGVMSDRILPLEKKWNFTIEPIWSNQKRYSEAALSEVKVIH